MSAMPVSVRSEFKTRLKYPKSMEIKSPPATAPKTPSNTLWVTALVSMPKKAAESMIPSKAMCSIPPRLQIRAAIAPRIRGVETRITENKNSGVKIAANILSITYAASFPSNSFCAAATIRLCFIL